MWSYVITGIVALAAIAFIVLVPIGWPTKSDKLSRPRKR